MDNNFEEKNLTELNKKIDPDFEEKLEENKTKSPFTKRKNILTGETIYWEKNINE